MKYFQLKKKSHQPKNKQWLGVTSSHNLTATLADFFPPLDFPVLLLGARVPRGQPLAHWGPPGTPSPPPAHWDAAAQALCHPHADPCSAQDRSHFVHVDVSGTLHHGANIINVTDSD